MKKKISFDKSHFIPLYLGITGHRDIRNEDRIILKEKIKDFILANQKQCPNSPVIILTPLAEGADRIAAEAAIECNVEFFAVLPMPIEEYKLDFMKPGSIEEFNRLVDMASMIIELPIQDGITLIDIRNNNEKRNEQYYQSGLFIARHCHTLIALWDGTNTGKKGGTSDVVRLKKSGIPGKFEDTSKKLHHQQTGPIYHIVTPRLSNAVPKFPFKVNINFPTHLGTDKAKAEKKDRQMLEHIDAYNKDIIKYESKLKAKINRSANKLTKDDAGIYNQQLLHSIALKHAVTSEMASLFQKRRFLALKVLLSLVVLSFLFLHINAEFFHNPLILLLYPVTMGIGAIWFSIARKKHFENKHEDYRALAEAYRIQFFLIACGKQDNVSDQYLKRHRGELEWVLYTLRTTFLFNLSSIHNPSVADYDYKIKVFNFLKKNWVDHQLEYFNDNTIKHSAASKKWETWASRSFISAIISALLLSIVSLYAEIIYADFKFFEAAMHSILACFTSVFLVLAAALHGYSDKMVFAEQSRNYQQMAQLFELASNKLTHAIETNDILEANDIIVELAQEALIENGDWLLLHRTRPMEIPKG
jgi:hypothetical protein